MTPLRTSGSSRWTRREFGSTRRPADPYAATDGTAGKFNDAAARRSRLPRAKRLRDCHAHARAFERALGRRVSWSFGGHQIKAAPHAFAEANAFYSPEDEALLFGYFEDAKGRAGSSTACRTTSSRTKPRTRWSTGCGRATWSRRARIRRRSTRASPTSSRCSPCSRFARSSSTPSRTRRHDAASGMVSVARLTIDALQKGVLLGLGEQFGEGLSGVHGTALRRSVKLKPSKTLKDTPDYLRGAQARRAARRLGAAGVPVGIPRPPEDAGPRLRRPAARRTCRRGRRRHRGSAAHDVDSRARLHAADRHQRSATTSARC